MANPSDVRLLTALLCPPARLELGRQLERAFYRRGWPALKYANDAWKNEPRGQPENKGRWVEAGGREAARQPDDVEAFRREAKAARSENTQKLRTAILHGLDRVSNEIHGVLQKHFFDRTMEAVHASSDTMLHAAAENIKTIRFFANSEDLAEHLRRRFPDMKPSAAVYVSDGTLLLNGAKETGEDTPWHVGQLYYHEMAHAADQDFRYSHDEDWRKAYRREFAASGDYEGLKDPEAEAFADFALMAAVRPDIVPTRFPEAFAFFKSKGLIDS